MRRRPPFGVIVIKETQHFPPPICLGIEDRKYRIESPLESVHENEVLRDVGPKQVRIVGSENAKGFANIVMGISKRPIVNPGSVQIERKSVLVVEIKPFSSRCYAQIQQPLLKPRAVLLEH